MMTEVDWVPNVERLQSIRKTVPGFWDHLSLIADGLSRSDYTMINDHDVDHYKVEYVTICQTYMLDDGLWPVMRYGERSPTAWVFPGPYKQHYSQSKNCMYLDNDGTVHWSMWAAGSFIRLPEIRELFRGSLVPQINNSLNLKELQFALPVELFVTVLQREKLA